MRPRTFLPCRAALGLAVLLLAACGTLRATEPQTPIERLMRRLMQGEAEAARAGVRELLDREIAAAAAALDQPADSGQNAAGLAHAIAWIADMVAIWEGNEVALQHYGGATPPEVYADVESRVRQADGLLKRLEEEAGKADSKLRRHRGDDRNLARARASVGDALAKTAAFLRLAPGRQEARRELVRSAARRGQAPESLEDFDARHPDLLALFRVQRRAPAVAPPPDASSPVSREQDPALYETLEAYYRALFAQDLEALRPLIAPEAWSEESLRQAARRFAGWKLRSLSDVIARQQKDGALRVHVAEIEAIDTSGKTVVFQKMLELRRTELGYRIVSP